MDRSAAVLASRVDRVPAHLELDGRGDGTERGSVDRSLLNGDFASQAERRSEIARNIAKECMANRFATDARGANVSAMSPHRT